MQVLTTAPALSPTGGRALVGFHLARPLDALGGGPQFRPSAGSVERFGVELPLIATDDP
jgi:hypothetical protein